MASITGDVGFMPVSDLIVWIANRQLTCTFQIRRRGVDISMVIRSGKLWQAASQDPREYLGQHLINFGYISEEQLQKAFDTQQETRVPLGRVLVMVDALTTQQLERVLVFKTRESLLETMSWTDGTFRLTDEVPDGRDLDAPAAIDLFEAHSEGVARATMWQEIRRVFPTDAVRVDVLVDPNAVASAFDRRLLLLMHAGRSIGEASLELRAMDFQSYARLYDLFNRKAVRPRLQSVASAQPGITLPHTNPLARSPFGPDQARAARAPTPMPVRGPGGAPVDVGRAPTPMPQALGRKPPPTPPDDAGFAAAGGYVLVRPEKPSDAPGVAVPPEANDPMTAMRVALAGRAWADALLLSQRILEADPYNSEAQAAMRVAEAQVRKSEESGAQIDLARVPVLAMQREQVALAHLSSKERYVLSRVDGKRSLQQIVLVSPIQKAELVRIVNAFVSKGVLRMQ